MGWAHHHECPFPSPWDYLRNVSWVAVTPTSKFRIHFIDTVAKSIKSIKRTEVRVADRSSFSWLHLTQPIPQVKVLSLALLFSLSPLQRSFSNDHYAPSHCAASENPTKCGRQTRERGHANQQRLSNWCLFRMRMMTSAKYRLCWARDWRIQRSTHYYLKWVSLENSPVRYWFRHSQ